MVNKVSAGNLNPKLRERNLPAWRRQRLKPCSFAVDFGHILWRRTKFSRKRPEVGRQGSI